MNLQLELSDVWRTVFKYLITKFSVMKNKKIFSSFICAFTFRHSGTILGGIQRDAGLDFGYGHAGMTGQCASVLAADMRVRINP